MADKITGACLCGAVQFSCEAELGHAHACHCKMCQKSGGVALSVKCTTPLEFESENDLRIYKSSDWGERLFCGTCGSSVAWRMQDNSLAFISTGTIDGDPNITFESQIFIDEKPDHYSFAEETKNMTGAEVMAEFAAGGDTG